MNRFKNLYINRADGRFHNTEYLTQAMFLHLRWREFLDDDYAKCPEQSFYEYFVDTVERLSPFFWVVVKDGAAVGIVYLENVTGSGKELYNSEITVCFDKSVWGGYTLETLKLFKRYYFEALGFRKIKALVYPQNFRVKTLLKRIGFKQEGLLHAETLKNGKPQDIEVYALAA